MRERYTVKVGQDESIWLVTKYLILCRIQKILGANGAEDYKDIAEYQMVSDQRPIQTCTVDRADLRQGGRRCPVE